MVMSQTLDCSQHVAEICEKSMKCIGAWKSVQYKLSRKHLEIGNVLVCIPNIKLWRLSI